MAYRRRGYRQSRKFNKRFFKSSRRRYGRRRIRMVRKAPYNAIGSRL